MVIRREDVIPVAALGIGAAGALLERPNPAERRAAQDRYATELLSNKPDVMSLGIQVPRGFASEEIVDYLRQSGVRNPYALGLDGGFVVNLPISPSDITVNMTPLITTTQTEGGWVDEHWGDAEDTLSGGGVVPHGLMKADFSVERNRDGTEARDKDGTLVLTTAPGSVKRKGPNSVINGQEVLNRSDYERTEGAFRLCQLFSGFMDRLNRVIINSRVTLWFSGDSYEGFFSSLDTTLDAETPLTVEYSFTFEVHHDHLRNVRGALR